MLMRRRPKLGWASAVIGLGLLVGAIAIRPATAVEGFLDDPNATNTYDAQIRANTRSLIDQGREVFRYDTFGSETFWGNTLGLHNAIQGSKFGGVGGGVSPKTALAVGLKVDADAIPAPVAQAIQAGQV